MDIELKTFSRRLNEDFDMDHLREAITDESYIYQETMERQRLGLDDSTLFMTSNKELAKSGKSIINNYCLNYLRTVFPHMPEEGVM